MKMFARLTGQSFGDWAINDRSDKVRYGTAVQYGTVQYGTGAIRYGYGTVRVRDDVMYYGAGVNGAGRKREVQSS